MENATLVAWIGGGCTVVAAGIGITKGWFKKPKSYRKIATRTGDISDSVVAVGGNITQITGTVNNYHASAPPPAGPFAGKVASRPSMVEIRDAIQGAGTPYDRTQIPKNYVGLKVSWPGVFSALSNYGVTWSARFGSPGEELYVSVSVWNIDLEKCPKLKVIKHGHPAWVEGEIDIVDLPIIRLADGAEITLE